MQQRLDLFGEVLPTWLNPRQDYGFVIYDLGDMWRKAYQSSGSVLLMLARKGISRLDVSPDRHVPDVLLFAMNPAEILALYAGYALLQATPKRLESVVNQRHFWQVLSTTCNAADTRLDIRPALKYLRRIDKMKGKPYPVGKMSLQTRVRQLPPRIAGEFMELYIQPSPQDARRIEQLPLPISGGESIDTLVFEHFRQRFKMATNK